MSKKDELNLKGPDAFQVRATESVEYLKANSKLVIGIVSLMAISAVGVIASNYFSDKSVMERQAAVTDVDQIFEKEVKVVSDQKAEIEKELDSLKLADKDKPSAENKKKISSLEASLKALDKPDHSASMEAYRRVYRQHEGTPQGMLAGIQYASLAVKADNLADAKDVLVKVTKASKNYTVLHYQSGMLLLSILEDLGQYDEALLQVDSLLANAGEELKPKILLAKGRILYLSKNLPGSLETLNDLITNHGSAQEAEKARSLKALIN